MTVSESECDALSHVLHVNVVVDLLTIAVYSAPDCTVVSNWLVHFALSTLPAVTAV